IWRQDAGSSIIPLKLDARGSLFVIFPENSPVLDSVLTVTRDGQMDNSAEVTFGATGKLQFLAAKAGAYQVLLSSGKFYQPEIKSLPGSTSVTGQWRLSFPPGSGAPTSVTLDALGSWSTHPNPSVKYFSG